MSLIKGRGKGVVGVGKVIPNKYGKILNYTQMNEKGVQGVKFVLLVGSTRNFSTIRKKAITCIAWNSSWCYPIVERIKANDIVQIFGKIKATTYKNEETNRKQLYYSVLLEAVQILQTNILTDEYIVRDEYGEPERFDTKDTEEEFFD